MATTIYSPKDIYDQEFKVSMRGFDRAEVDEFLDNVIGDYELFLAEIDSLKAENARLKAELAGSAQQTQETAPVFAPPFPVVEPAPVSTPAFETPVEPRVTVTGTATNYDILKRISRLEKEVFGKQITE